MSNSLDTLKDNRNGILFIELAGLLHDIGKLSEAFLRYRQTWQADENGWWKDPHEHCYLDEHEVLRSYIPKEFNITIEALKCYDFGEPDFSIRKAVHDHYKDRKKIALGPLIKTLQAADGKDAAIDRNNPLFSAEQKNDIYKSNVFGFEQDRKIEYKSQEDAREQLYDTLRTKLPEYFNSFSDSDRRQILKDIEEAFKQGISDTTRPQNDTSLWEHAYAVASILKALSVHNLFNKGNEIYRVQDVRFGIFGVGWDGLKFISYGEKIGDIVGRKKLLNGIKKSIKKIIEFESPIGNTIYEDDDGIYFVVPAYFDKFQYTNIRDAILKEIYKTTADKSAGELQPYAVDIPETDSLTSIVRAIAKMRKKTSYRFDSGEHGFNYLKKRLQKFQQKKTVCPVCRLREVNKEDASRKICSVCEERRRKASAMKKEKMDAELQTVFIDEIIDEHQGAALIVAQFGLRNWLNGKMIRTLFVSEAKGIQREIESLGAINAFCVNDEKKLRSFFKDTKYNYSRIVEDIDSFSPGSSNKQRARNTAFLYAYGRRDLANPDDDKISEIYKAWTILMDSAKQEINDPSREDILLYNILNAKSPTPSTILDVWMTTLRFFKKEISEILPNEFFKPNNRLRIKTKEEMSQWKKWRGTLKAELIYKKGNKQTIEILFIDSRHLEVIGKQYDETAKDYKQIKIVDKDYKNVPALFDVEESELGHSIASYRVITETPNIYMAIVPANKTLEITKSIYDKYTEQFGKVIGRLPLSIGNIFFRKKMPMFVVLDAGKRMLNNFERMANNKKKVLFDIISRKDANGKSSLNISVMLGIGNEAYKRTIQWNLPDQLRNNKKDYYHPYFIVSLEKDDLSARPTFFKSVSGDVIHFTKIEKGDTLCVKPNYYDFEFLDSNIRRHDIQIDNDLRRKSNIANFRSKPFLLDEVDQKVIEIWEHLIQGKQLQGITDAKLRNLQSLWLTKYQEWSVNLDEPDSCKMWSKLVEASVKKEFSNITERIKDILLETIKNGVFFDMLELYIGILKLRVDTGKKKEGEI